MNHYEEIRKALTYIDQHLVEAITFESLAELCHFSPYYFHRVFSLVVGQTISAYIRSRRLAKASAELSSTNKPILAIALDCGYPSAQSFSRAFRGLYGMPPSEYRRTGLAPDAPTIDDMIKRFTNRIRGGVYVHPRIMQRGAISIAGVAGDGMKTGEVWSAFEKLHAEKPLEHRLSNHGYEIRLYDGDACTVHVGYAVSGGETQAPYEVFCLPATKYASFDVFVADGYDGENGAMDGWLRTNEEGYRERLLGGTHYCVEYYDERFKGSEAGSIVEIWIPIEQKKA